MGALCWQTYSWRCWCSPSCTGNGFRVSGIHCSRISSILQLKKKSETSVEEIGPWTYEPKNYWLFWVCSSYYYGEIWHNIEESPSLGWCFCRHVWLCEKDHTLCIARHRSYMYSEDKNDGAWYVQCFFLPPLPPHDYTFLAVANNANRTNIFRSCYYTLNLLPTPWRNYPKVWCGLFHTWMRWRGQFGPKVWMLKLCWVIQEVDQTIYR